MIIDKERKVLFKKYLISKFPLTKIFFLNEHFICAGEGPLIYCWKYENEKIDYRNVFSFLESGKDKATLLFSHCSVNEAVIVLRSVEAKLSFLAIKTASRVPKG